MEGQRDTRTNPTIHNPDIKYEGIQYASNPGAEYGDQVKGTFAICNTSSSHTYGNVLSVVEKYILDLFPADTFKTITATTSLASRQMTHLPRQLMKKELPMMVLAPRISFGQEDNRFLANTIMNSRMTNTFANWGDGSLLPLAYDRRKNIHIHGHYNRSVMYVDIVLSFTSFMEQTNWMSYIHNMIPINHNFFIKSPLELFLPEEFCNLVGKLAGVEIENDDSVANYLSYMNSIWFHPITYKLKGSSNNNSFFMYYIADVDTVVQEPQAAPGLKDGQVRRNFDISFTVRCDFNTIGYFTVNSPEIRRPLRLNSKESGAVIPIFSDVIDLKNFQLPVGWSVLGFPIFKLDHGEDSISIASVMNDSLRTMVAYHLKYKIPIERFLTIQFRENGNILDTESYHIDWEEMRLIVTHPDYHRTYRLLILTSHEYVNTMIKEIYKLE